MASYEVFYMASGNKATQSGGTVAHPSTQLQLSGIFAFGVTYAFFVVAYSSDEENLLPSEPCYSAKIFFGKGVMSLSIK